MSTLPLLMFVVLFALLFTGTPVAFALAGVGLLFALIGTGLGAFDWHQIANLLPKRIYDNTVDNEILIAVPLFVLMGMLLDRSGLAQDLLLSMQRLTGRLRGGLAVAVVLVGALLGAATGVVGATVVTLGVLALPTMLEQGYDRRLAGGTVAAAGTLGQIIPPSIVLILLGDQMNVSVGKLFQGALLPSLVLVGGFVAWILLLARLRPDLAPPPSQDQADLRPGLLRDLTVSLAPALGLIVLVLGSIILGLATPTEASGCGAVGALVLALVRRRLGRADIQDALRQTVQVTAMVLLILAGSQLFGLVFQRLQGGEQIAALFAGTGLGPVGFIYLLMALVFLLGFFLDFLEICFIVVPVLMPVLEHFGLVGLDEKVLIGVLLALNLQTSFLTPPFGFSLFYLKGAAGDSLPTSALYRGIIPFVLIQILTILIVWFVPDLVLAIPMAGG